MENFCRPILGRDGARLASKAAYDAGGTNLALTNGMTGLEAGATFRAGLELWRPKNKSAPKCLQYLIIRTGGEERLVDFDLRVQIATPPPSEGWQDCCGLLPIGERANAVAVAFGRVMDQYDRAALAYFYEFRLDDRIAQNHLLRRIDVFLTTALADLRKELEPYYSETGRPSVDP